MQSHRSGKDATLLTYGSMLENTLKAASLLTQEGIEVTVLRLQEVSQIPAAEILDAMSENRRILVVEEVCNGSGIREAISWEIRMLCPDCIVDGLDLGADFVPHGNQKLLYKHCGLDEASIARYVKEVLLREN